MAKVWFITGAARGMGVHLAKAALDAGHRVVGTARNAGKVTAALGEQENLLALSLEVTDPAASATAVEAAVELPSWSPPGPPGPAGTSQSTGRRRG